jgi:hypothetical protein
VDSVKVSQISERDCGRLADLVVMCSRGLSINHAAFVEEDDLVFLSVLVTDVRFALLSTLSRPGHLSQPMRFKICSLKPGVSKPHVMDLLFSSPLSLPKLHVIVGNPVIQQSQIGLLTSTFESDNPMFDESF